MLVGYVPPEIIRTLRAFLDFCYIARREIIDTSAIAQLEDSLEQFHENRTIFVEAGIRDDSYDPPRQHSLDHYARMIREFGAPNGLCSSITESKHIKAVKEPWRRSNRYNALQQMITTNSRVDKLAAARVHFETGGLLHSDPIADMLNGEQGSAPGILYITLLTLSQVKQDFPALFEDDDGDAVGGRRTEPFLALSVKPIGTLFS